MPKGYVMAVMHDVPAEYPAELKKEIFQAIGDIDHIDVWGEEILVAPYAQPLMQRGIIRPGTENEEDKWQSKSFLVLKVGDGVEKAAKAHGKKVPIVGAWYYGNVQEHWMLNVRGVGAKGHKLPGASEFYRPWGNGGWPCRQVLFADIRGKTMRPQDIL